MRTLLRRSAVVLGILVLTGIVVVWGGTFAQSRLSGDLLGPCTRALDSDNSTWQNGHASMHWFPPRIHCSFPADSLFGTSAASTDEAAVGGIVVFGFIAVAVLFVLLVSWVNAGVIEVERKPLRRPALRE